MRMHCRSGFHSHQAVIISLQRLSVQLIVQGRILKCIVGEQETNMVAETPYDDDDELCVRSLVGLTKAVL